MIVRIATEGQYELARPTTRPSTTSTTRPSRPSRPATRTASQGVRELIEIVRSKGRKLGDEDLRHSDVILPPEDTDLEEAGGFTGEGAIPDSLIPD